MAPLLTYSLSTSPVPITANLPNASAPASCVLTLVVQNLSENDVTLLGISLQLPVGSEASDLVDNASIIKPVMPSTDWSCKDETASGSYTFIFNAPDSFSMGKGDILYFVFNNVQTNTLPGTCELTVTEGSSDDKPTETLSLTKFPSGWGAVSFAASAYNVSAGTAVSLTWNGPSSVTYGLQYLDYSQNPPAAITLPAAEQSALGANGTYPGQNEPALVPLQTTVYTLTGSTLVGNEPISFAQQLTVEVIEPSPQIVQFTSAPLIVDFTQLPLPPITLSWQTSNVSLLHIDGVGDYGDTQAAQGSAVAPVSTNTYLAEGYPLTGASSAQPVSAKTTVASPIGISVATTVNESFTIEVPDYGALGTFNSALVSTSTSTGGGPLHNTTTTVSTYGLSVQVVNALGVTDGVGQEGINTTLATLQNLAAYTAWAASCPAGAGAPTLGLTITETTNILPSYSVEYSPATQTWGFRLADQSCGVLWLNSVAIYSFGAPLTFEFSWAHLPWVDLDWSDSQ